MRVALERLHRNWCRVGITEFQLPQRTGRTRVRIRPASVSEPHGECPPPSETHTHKTRGKVGGTIIPRQAENLTQN